uniref:Uncharacterized protein n=1 Tax=Arundo donax TaxID=35708 RepID=A0A0A9BT69_ARUDO
MLGIHITGYMNAPRHSIAIK